MPGPRTATTPPPGARSDGALGAFVAHLHGRPWKAHQRAAAELAGAQLETGAYAFPTFVWTFPRQCGKTTAVHDLLIGRGLQLRDYRAAYAAQTGHITTARFGELFTALEAGPLLSRLKLRRSAGTERVTQPRAGSYLMAFPPKSGALRSFALDAVAVDEAQEHEQVLGLELDTTIIPTFTTRPRRQYLIVGTAGTDASEYLRRHRSAAIAGAPGYGLIEYGAPADADHDDESLWPLWHPGLASGLTDLPALRQARLILGAASFAREYLNVWSRTSSHALDPASWALAIAHPQPMPAGPLAIGIDVSADRASWALAIAGPRSHLELIESGPYELQAAVARVRQLADQHAALVAIDQSGPTGPLADALIRGQLPGLRIMAALDVANAAATFSDQLHTGALTVWPHPDLDLAVQVAVKRRIGDAGFGWSRRLSAGNVAPLVAGSAALWALLRDPGPPLAPVTDSG